MAQVNGYSSTPTSPDRLYTFWQSPTRIMAVGLVSGARHAAEEEARAEVDVLNSRLEKTTQLTKKIEACLGRLEATGKSVREVVGPLNGETKKLQTLGHSACWLSGVPEEGYEAGSIG